MDIAVYVGFFLIMVLTYRVREYTKSRWAILCFVLMIPYFMITSVLIVTDVDAVPENLQIPGKTYEFEDHSHPPISPPR
jgi:hypothetical protein